ncbi:hypothetical protein OO013_11405 [Mangrovivirga sp. M17]|uniref:Uncharacterized protein n=1 Tax=Mangrovivirga halotolerans TaxID=2993936 RepID=A0ABT3RRR7_9BACT|nr:hypothetical protein [Mangrovivirga halotolerans]MCX2744476.1 hypothetical protein [Mangrovivirga halotolerans]
MKKFIYLAVFLMCLGVVVYQYVIPMWLANQLNDTQGADISLLPEKVQKDVRVAQKEFNVTIEKFEEVKASMPEEVEKVSSEELINFIDKVKVSEMKAAVKALSEADFNSTEEAWNIGMENVTLDEEETNKFKPYYDAVFTTDKIKRIVATLEEHNLLNSLSGPVIKQTAKEFIRNNSEKIDEVEPEEIK